MRCDRHLNNVHVPSERSMAQLRVQVEIIGQLEAQVGQYNGSISGNNKDSVRF